MRKVIVIASIAVLVGLEAGAAAQQASAEPPAQGAPAAGTPATPAAGAPVAPAGAAVAVPAEPPSPVQAQPLREQCENALLGDAQWRSELKAQLARSLLKDKPDPADAQWRAELKQQLASEVHSDDAKLMLANKKHVVMAYAALWILVAGFVVLMWMKQQTLKAEIARLEREIRDAAKQGGA